MLLAETVTFDPGIVVLFFLVLLTVFCLAASVVVAGLISGVRTAHDPDRTRPRVVFRTCVALEGAALSVSVVTGWEEGAVALVGILGLTAVARLAPSSRA